MITTRNLELPDQYSLINMRQIYKYTRVRPIVYRSGPLYGMLPVFISQYIQEFQ